MTDMKTQLVGEINGNEIQEDSSIAVEQTNRTEQNQIMKAKFTAFGMKVLEKGKALVFSVMGFSLLLLIWLPPKTMLWSIEL